MSLKNGKSSWHKKIALFKQTDKKKHVILLDFFFLNVAILIQILLFFGTFTENPVNFLHNLMYFQL